MIHSKRRAALPRGVVQAAYVVGGLAAGVLLGSVDLGPPLSPARVVQLLAGIAAGLLSLFGIVYSVLFFVVPFAATSQSPRLNLFRRHPLVWHSTAALAGSAVYCIAAGFAVASRDRASVGVAVVAVALVGAAFALIVALQGVAFRFVQLAPVLDQISSRGEAVLDELFPGHLDSTDGGAGGGADGTVATAPVDVETVTDGPDAAGGGTVVHWRERPRVLRRVDGAGLVEFLREADATAVLHVSPGARLRHGDRVLTVSGATALAQPPARLLRFLDAGLERSFEQDPAFAFRLLSDIGLRALSPAVNDHATAVAAIEESGSLLRVLVHRDLGSGRLCDSEGTVRLRHPSTRAPMTTSPPVSTVVQLKVRRPPLGPSLVPRERLVDAIEEGSRRRCTLVSAGAGFGKSVALSTWAAGHGSVEPVAWLSLDVSDSDPQRLCAHLLAAVQEALPPRPTSSGPPAVATDGGTARSPQAAHGAGGALPAQLSRVLELRPPPAAGRDFVEEALIPALQALGRPMVLVVDDVHVLASSPEALSILDTLLRWAPPEMRFVLAGRSDPPLALPRLRLAGQLTVLRQQHLGFTEDETVALLRGAGLRLTTGNERSLHELTHGWPAAVRLAAVSLAERGAVPEALEGVLTEDVALADYLASEVLHGLPAELSAFLLRATIDDLVCPDLVERVTGSADSVALLRACQRRNLFLTRVDTDDGPDWYSWHQLFATLMRRRLEFSDPSEARRAHLAAADWWRTRDAVRAVEHAAEGRSQSLGLEILTETWPALALRGESGTLLDLVDLVPSGTDQEAEVRLATCYARLLHGDSASAATELARALAARDRLPAALVRRFDARAAWLRLSLVEERTSLRDVVRQARSLVDDPLTRRELSPTEYALACLATGIGQSRLQEDAVTALRTLRAAEEAGRVAHLDVLVFAARAEQGFPLIAEGRILEMQRSAAELVDDAARRGWASFGPLAMPRFVLGWLAHWRGDPTGALDQLEAAAACCPATDWALRGLISYFHGMASLVVGEMAAAELDLKEARALAVAGCLPPFADSLLAGFDAEITAARGDLPGALRAATTGAAPEYRLTTCTRADLLRRLGREAESLAALDELAPEPYEHIRTLEAVLRCLALDALGKSDEAQDALGEAIAVAASARLVGPFSAHASALSPLLERYLRRGPAHEAFTAEVSERLAAGSPQHQTGRHARLTPSELKVLHRLRTPMSNAEIAAELFVSVNTVKTHAASVYRKLGVDGRRSAVKQAYEHGLFEPVPAGRSASPVPP